MPTLHSFPPAWPAGRSCLVAAVRGDAPDKFRSTSRRRIGKMKELVAELSRRDMDHADVMALLDCSRTSARIYIGELLCAGVAEQPPCGRNRAAGERTFYRIAPDRAVVGAFLAAAGDSAYADNVGHAADKGGRHFHILADDVAYPLVVDDAKVLRDPLVAALFGASKA
ncbi:ArsR family transcriptional regulator [Massilia cavernae]|uniref:ArsR family transcriptional regulator n=1 Tax=Massilia cavernae TaxID=2320864 RepID=A0A418XFP0_9BURK|nr:ArsR family transcriptional regulator [Massilia cavernae]RJG11275.1 ArsR family transcriptional regulator [Massilia cavernae]